MQKDFTYLSTDGKTNVHAICWEPEGAPRAILQIAHGMIEFIARYKPFAEYLTEHGFLVVGNDHLGHGETGENMGEFGFFAEPDGNACVIGDMRKLQTLTQEQYPDVPYFFLGHSMGSFLARQYIELYGDSLAGAIIMGTGFIPPAVLTAAKTMARTAALFHGWHYESPMLAKLTVGSYNKSFQPARTPYDWLTKDEAIVDAYAANPWNTFKFRTNAYYHMFRGLAFAEKAENIRKIPQSLPILLVSGANDPVGDMGKGVQTVFDEYKKNGITNVEMKLYPGDRHEILNELDRAQVFADLLAWLDSHMPAEAQA